MEPGWPSSAAAVGASSRVSFEAWSSGAGGSAGWPFFRRPLPCGFGAGVIVAAGRALVRVTGPVFSPPSPTDQNAHPLQALLGDRGPGGRRALDQLVVALDLVRARPVASGVGVQHHLRSIGLALVPRVELGPDAEVAVLDRHGAWHLLQKVP